MVLWCCGARSLKSEDRSPPGPRALLRWFQSGRNRLGKMNTVWLFSIWHSGVMVKAVVYEAQGGEDRFPAGPKSTFKLVSEWKKRIRKL